MPGPLSAANLLNASSQAVLKKLFPDTITNTTTYNAWKYLFMCFETPRPSSKEEMIRNKIIEVANHMGVSSAVDQIGNIRLRKPASPGCEDRVKICLQAHIDMVCSKKTTSNHCFDTMGVDFDITPDGKTIKADGTTLGADDGAGVAAALAILEEDSSVFKHGPIEVLLTIDEEVSMLGALELKSDFLESEALINLDSEEANSICVGCAGGAETKMFIPVTRQPAFGKAVDVDIHGLMGGHTGCDIHTERGNAIKYAARIIRAVTTSVESATISAVSGGNAPNAIPRDAKITFVCNEADVDEVKRIVAETLAFMKTEQPDEVNAVAEVTVSDCGENQPINKEAASNIAATLLSIPHGVIRYSPTVKGEVETSNSLSIVGLSSKSEVVAAVPENKSRHGHCPESGPETDNCWVHCFYRSFVDHQLTLVGQRLEDIALLAKADVTAPFGYFNGWEPKTDSPVFTTVVEAHKNITNGAAPRIYAIHAGLECGILIKATEGKLAHAVSIGPTILDAHSPDEHIIIDTMEPFVDWLKVIVNDLAKIKSADL